MSRTACLRSVAVLALAGCASLPRDAAPVRLVTGRAPTVVVAAALDALAAAGVQGVTLAARADGGRAVIRGWAVAGGYERHPFAVRVTVTADGAAVRVGVEADPLEAEGDPLAVGPQPAPHSGCACASADLIKGDAYARDDLLLLAQGRRLTGAVLAELDARLR